MTTKITVSVNGDHKVPVKKGNDEPVYVSGRGSEVAVTQDFYPDGEGDGAVFVIGPEEPDAGEPTAED